MKQNPSDPDDNLFLARFQKSPKELSKEDKELFEEWINHTDPKEWRNGKKTPPVNQIKKTSLQEPKNIPYKTHTNDQALFIHWIDHKIPKINPHHHKNTPMTSKSPKTIKTDIPFIDLHGFTKIDALGELKRFLSSLPRGIKKARIIHGKGLSSGQPSIIRQEIREWLSIQKKYASWLADFSYENPQNGGHGATIVWIKKGEHYEKH